MIIRRLYELTHRENLLADPAFDIQSVPFYIEVGDGGAILGDGISERRGTITTPSKKKGGEPKTKSDNGLPVSAPRPHGNTATQGFARFCVDAVSRILPMAYDLAQASDAKRLADLAKRARSRETFWNQVDRAADETGDPALRAVQAFGRRLTSDPGFAVVLERSLREKGAKATDRCTFAYAPDSGRHILQRETIRAWFRGFYREYTGDKQEAGPTGLCQISGHTGPIPNSHPIKLSVPGWSSFGVSLVSYDKAAFESYGLEGTSNAAIGYEAADAYGMALKALTQDKRRRLHVGESLFLFWTRDPEPTDFMDLFSAPTTEGVTQLFNAPLTGSPEKTSPSENEFYCLALSSNASRAIVRDYLELKLPAARRNIASWFGDLKIASTNRDDHGHPIATFPLRSLAAAMTAPKSGNQPDWLRINDLVPRLMAAALKGEPLPDGVLASCLQRLRAEGEGGFRPTRLALIKLCLIRKGISVSEKMNPLESNPAYICGELLAIFDEIQRAALGKLKANVVDKHYGGFCAAPSTELGGLFRNAQNHLRSLRGEKPARAASLDKRLALASRKLNDVPAGQLTLADQARFALGYYHAKADRLEVWAASHQKDRTLTSETKQTATVKASKTARET
jgi:CRISPR-associated protein Csd1